MVLEKKAKKKATRTRKSARRQEVSDPSFDGSEAHSSREDEEEDEETSPPPAGGEKKKAALSREARGSKKGKTLPPDYSADADDGGDEWQPRAEPLAKS